MEMRRQHDLDVVSREAGLHQTPLERSAAAVDRINIDALRVHLPANSRVDDHRLFAADDERPQAKTDAVARVGRGTLFPERLGNDAEHGAAVEAERAVAEGNQLEIAETHRDIIADSGTPASIRRARHWPPTDE
jgi:hypothetical protein